MPRSAATAEIVRSHQKDDLYLSFLRKSVADVVQSLTGPLRWMRWHQELDVICDIVYFFLTTFGGYQTIGEEYVNIILVDQTKRFLPSRLNRAAMILLQICTPYILQRVLDKLERKLQSVTPLPVRLTGLQRERLLALIPVVRQAITLVHRAHLSLFYIQGTFYHLAKRLTGINYIHPMLRQDHSNLSRPFRLLGILSLLQLGVSACVEIHSTWKAMKSRSSGGINMELNLKQDDGMTVHPKLKCSLCLGRRQRSTLTVCGHLFCWKCIHQWCQQKAECPLCREPLPPHRLVALQNYDPT